MTRGRGVARVLEGVNAIENTRKLVGSTEQKAAAPGTIRGDYAHISMAYASKMGLGGKNIIHASGTLNEAKDEIKLWFGKDELHSYTTVHEKHVF